MRVESSATTLSWIPSHSIVSGARHAFALGLAHWDRPLPDRISGVDEVRDLVRDDRLRFGNVLTAWAEVHEGRIVDAGVGPDSGVVMGSTTVRVGAVGASFAAIGLPVIRPEPERADDGSRVAFRQTAGGRTAIPVPRPVPRPPFVQWTAPLVWTTLELVLHVDGRVESSMSGASAFPRHWLYGTDGRLVGKSGLADERTWLDHSFGPGTPWGAGDSPALVSAVESALEHRLSEELMRGRAPEIRSIRVGDELTRQGDAGTELFLLLDGVLAVEVDAAPIGEVGPGAILGERAILEAGRRTATLRARTAARVAVAPAEAIDRDRLRDLADHHRREDDPQHRSVDAL